MSFFSLKHKNLVDPRIYLFVCVLILMGLACNFPTASKQVAPGEEQLPSSTDTPEVSDTPQITDTPEVSETPTLTPTITNTPTPEVAMVYVSQNTNCRTGPGTVFAWLLTLNEGEEAEAVARGPAGEYWYIKRPDQPSSNCCLWAKYATPSGPYEALPIWTPIPTPTQSMDFKISFHSNIGNCGPFWYLQYRIDNTGGIKLESWRTMSNDHTGGSVPIENFQDKFYDITGCGPAGHQEDLTPGEAYYINTIYDNDPVGHDITVKVKICKKNGLDGKCLEKNYRHTP